MAAHVLQPERLDEREDPNAPLLAVDGLRVVFKTQDGVVHAVDGVSWQVGAGETLGVVGESGSGKSVTALAVLGLIPSPPGVVEAGRILLRGRDLLAADEDELRLVRGRDIAMIFQDPLTALNPVLRIGDQVAEILRVHTNLTRKASQARAVDLLAEVGISNPARRAREYPHQFSGGMRQRAMIAMAMANDPEVLLADEPTTALDVTVQAQILDLLDELQERRRAGIVLITHDLGVIAGRADYVVVMYAGRVMEQAPVEELFTQPRHAYTLGLLRSLARLDRPRRAQLTPIVGQPPSLLRPPPGCPFHPRCPFATELCRTERPALAAQGRPDHLAACHHADQVAAAAASGAAS